MPSPLSWTRFKGPDNEWWRVGLSCEDDSPALREADGWTYFDTHTVLIDVEPTREEQEETFVHELLHVSMAHLPHDPDEERIVTKAAPGLVKILKQFGFRFPRRPRGVAALERRARGEDQHPEEEET